MEFRVEDRLRRPLPQPPDRKHGDGSAPTKPDVQRPQTKDLLERMKRIDPDTAKRYRQRSGQ